MSVNKVKKVLFIGVLWPEPDATGAGVRIGQLLTFFYKQGYEISFASADERDMRIPLFEELPIKKVHIALNSDSFNTYLLAKNPDVVVFDRFLTEEQYGWRVTENAPNALRILDSEDLHSLRKTREQAFKKQIPHNTAFWLSSDEAKRELASIHRVDITLVISTYEMKLLQEILRIPLEKLCYLPFMYAEGYQDDGNVETTFQQRTDFMCIGNGKHAPNIDAFLWLKQVIWPGIKKLLPNANLSIYGAYLPQQILQLHHPKQGFFVHGKADDVDRVMQHHRVNLAPLRFGAGIKGKITTAWYNGLPTVTTDIGAEGMSQGEYWPGAICSHADDFIAVAVAMYTEKSIWESAQVLGYDLLKSRYSEAQNYLRLNNAINVLSKQGSLQKHRANDIYGGLLLHHSMQSTKYLSKWIAEKNK